MTISNLKFSKWDSGVDDVLQYILSSNRPFPSPILLPIPIVYQLGER